MMAAFAFLASLIIVGVPAALLKVIATFSALRSSAMRRGKLLPISIGAGALAGLSAILFYFGLPIPPTILILGMITIPELVATITLIWMAIALDQNALQYCRTQSGPAVGKGRRIAWLVGSNLWIPWALVILFTFSSGEFLTACGGIDLISNFPSADMAACQKTPRRYWSDHADAFEEALRLGREQEDD